MRRAGRDIDPCWATSPTIRRHSKGASTRLRTRRICAGSSLFMRGTRGMIGSAASRGFLEEHRERILQRRSSAVNRNQLLGHLRMHSSSVRRSSQPRRSFKVVQSSVPNRLQYALTSICSSIALTSSQWNIEWLYAAQCLFLGDESFRYFDAQMIVAKRTLWRTSGLPK